MAREHAEALIYLDHHATTPVDPRVVEAMRPWWTTQAGNAASISHRAGLRARDAVEAARAKVAALVHCESEEVILTSGATEANNLALKGLCGNSPTSHRLISNVAEHRAVLDPLRRLKRMGAAVELLPVDAEARVDPELLRAALRTPTSLTSVMWANNEVGSLNDIPQLAQKCRAADAVFHVDAAQAVGKVPIDLRSVPIDLLSLSAHKLYGPQGIGALIVRRERRLPLTPLLDGGGHERGLRSGTLPVALVVGFGAACAVASEQLSEECRRLSRLRDRLWDGLAQAIPELRRNSPANECLPHNLNVHIPHVDGDVLLMQLQASRLCVSSGSACTSANPEPSHVLRAMGLSDLQARASLRFGLGRTTTEQEIEATILIVADLVRQIRSSGAGPRP
ncbi:MAG: cysteine desulfurase [Planctomycetaceae bacterium]|nr:cysteine desulfurase [Planctomycetaceae bacterium]